MFLEEGWTFEVFITWFVCFVSVLRVVGLWYSSKWRWQVKFCQSSWTTANKFRTVSCYDQNTYLIKLSVNLTLELTSGTWCLYHILNIIGSKGSFRTEYSFTISNLKTVEKPLKIPTRRRNTSNWHHRVNIFIMATLINLYYKWKSFCYKKSLFTPSYFKSTIFNSSVWTQRFYEWTVKKKKKRVFINCSSFNYAYQQVPCMSKSYILSVCTSDSIHPPLTHVILVFEFDFSSMYECG